jgi:hypothetical protein
VLETQCLATTFRFLEDGGISQSPAAK